MQIYWFCVCTCMCVHAHVCECVCANVRSCLSMYACVGVCCFLYFATLDALRCQASDTACRSRMAWEANRKQSFPFAEPWKWQSMHFFLLSRQLSWQFRRLIKKTIHRDQDGESALCHCQNTDPWISCAFLITKVFLSLWLMKWFFLCPYSWFQQKFRNAQENT